MKRELSVTGVSDHGGWAVFVTVAALNGLPVVVDRRRLETLGPGLPSQPYHHDTLGLDIKDAEALVTKVRASALECSIHALKPKPAAIVLREPPLPQMPASVAEAHAAYQVMTRSDGMLYHDALTRAAAAIKLPVVMIKRGEERTHAAEILGTIGPKLDRWLAAWRENLGAPWQQEHQDSTARAIAVLGKHVRLTLPGE
jgi:hypothetical protein